MLARRSPEHWCFPRLDSAQWRRDGVYWREPRPVGLAAAIAVRKPLREEPGHTGDLAALDQSASLFEAYGATSFDKFSTQKRRTEMTAKSAFGRQHVAHRDSKPRRLPGGHGDPAGIFAYPSHYLASIHVAL
jgi:hypothetical protein